MEKPQLDLITEEQQRELNRQIDGMMFTKNFRSPSAEEWYVFLPGYSDPRTGGAAGKVIVHYNLLGTKEISINTTVIWDDLRLHSQELHYLVYGLCDELVNRLVGYASTLLSVHAGENSYDAKYN